MIQTKSSGVILPEVHGAKKILEYEYITGKTKSSFHKIKRLLKINQD